MTRHRAFYRDDEGIYDKWGLPVPTQEKHRGELRSNTQSRLKTIHRSLDQLLVNDLIMSYNADVKLREAQRLVGEALDDLPRSRDR